MYVITSKSFSVILPFMTGGTGHPYDRFAPCGCLSGFEDDFLKEYEHWFLALNWGQCFLGRSMLFLKRHAVDESELTGEEVLDKHRAYLDWHQAVTNAFHPDKINQAQLGNEEFLHRGHVHWHFIPRYRRPISFAGVTLHMDDAQMQKRIYSDVYTPIVHPPELRQKIRDELLKYL